jgi:hypothetical protein
LNRVKSISIRSARILYPNSIYVGYRAEIGTPIRADAKFAVHVIFALLPSYFEQKCIKFAARMSTLTSLMASTPARLCAFQLSYTFMEPECIDGLESEDVVDFVDALFDGDNDEHAAVLAACTAAVATSLIGNEDTAGASPFKGRLTGSQSVARDPCRWFQDYLTAQPICPPHRFRRIFRIPLKLYALLKV